MNKIEARIKALEIAQEAVSKAEGWLWSMHLKCRPIPKTDKFRDIQVQAYNQERKNIREIANQLNKIKMGLWERAQKLKKK